MLQSPMGCQRAPFRPSQVFWGQDKHLTLELIKRIVDRRERKPERAIRDAVEGLRADLPSKLRKHEDIAVCAFVDYVDPRNPFPLVFVASQCERRVCRCEGDIFVSAKSHTTIACFRIP